MNVRQYTTKKCTRYIEKNITKFHTQSNYDLTFIVTTIEIVATRVNV